jgi:hypothetical protein
MNRFVDVYSANGEQLAQLGGGGITAVPAVAVFHPSKDWVAAGTASGKLLFVDVILARGSTRLDGVSKKHEGRSVHWT